MKGQDRVLLVNLAEEVAKLSAHAGQLKMDYEALRRGQGSLGQDLNTLQAEQGRLIQVRHHSDVDSIESNMMTLKTHPQCNTMQVVQAETPCDTVQWPYKMRHYNAG